MNRKAKVHWIIYSKPVLISVIGAYLYYNYTEYTVIAHLLFVIALLMFLSSFWYIVSNSLTIDDSYVTLRRGVFSTVKDRVPVEKIENFRVYKSLLGNILNFGTIKYGNDSSYPSFKYISNPDTFLVDTNNSVTNNQRRQEHFDDRKSVETGDSGTETDYTDDDLGDVLVYYPHIPKTIHRYLKASNESKYRDSNFIYQIEVGTFVHENQVIAKYGDIEINAPCPGKVVWLGSQSPGTYDWSDVIDGYWMNDDNSSMDWRMNLDSREDSEIRCPESAEKKHFYSFGFIPVKEKENFIQHQQVRYVFNKGEVWLDMKKQKGYSFYTIIDLLVYQMKGGKGIRLPWSLEDDEKYKEELLKYWHIVNYAKPVIKKGNN